MVTPSRQLPLLSTSSENAIGKDKLGVNTAGGQNEHLLLTV